MSANVRNLNDSKEQALRVLRDFSERFGDVLGEISSDGTRRNEGGDMVNEDGLPIIDITEPVNELDSHRPAVAEEDQAFEDALKPISELSPEALATRRRDRDKILELLEEEEEREELRSRRELQNKLEEKRERARTEMQKRMVSQGLDLERRRRAEHLENKMAKALISEIGDPAPVASKTSTPNSEGTKKKTVSFAEPPSLLATKPPPEADPAEGNKWGDVVLGRLPSKEHRFSSSRRQVMKRDVVERGSAVPPSQPASTSLPPTGRPDFTNFTGDSDDESISEDASDIALGSGDEDAVLSAKRGRELASEYRLRREAMASNARSLDLHDPGLHDNPNEDVINWEKEDVPLEATLAHPPPKASISKFKASRLHRMVDPSPGSISEASAPGSTAASKHPTFGTSTLSANALSNSIRMGKLVNDQLVTRHEDEEMIRQEEREEEEVRRLLLKSIDEYTVLRSGL